VPSMAAPIGQALAVFGNGRRRAKNHSLALEVRPAVSPRKRNIGHKDTKDPAIANAGARAARETELRNMAGRHKTEIPV